MSQGRYRAIHCRIWNDDKFPQLSPIAKLVFFHLLTTPMGSPFGLFKSGLAGLAEEARLPLEAYREAFQEAFLKGLAKQCKSTLLVWVPNVIRYNPPQSPNVVKSWGKIFHELPDGNLKAECYQQLKIFIGEMGEAFAKAFREGFWED